MKTKSPAKKLLSPYKKTILFWAKIATLLSILFVIFSISPGKSTLVNQACATGWGAACTNSPGPSYHICPATGQAYGGCVQSAMFNVTIAGTRIPPGQTFDISISPANSSDLVCSSVTCLKRSTGYRTGGWAGSPISVTLDQIGCATNGECGNSFRVRVQFAQPYVNGNLNCPNPPDVIVDIQNGFSKPANFNITCDAPPTPTNTPTLTPTRTPTLTPTRTITVTLPPGATVSPTPSRTPTPSPTRTPTPSPSRTPTPSPTRTPTPSPSRTPTPSPTRTPTPSPSRTPTPSPSRTPTPSPTRTPTPSFTVTPTENPICPVPAVPVVHVTCPLCSN